jgi:hypothetical protein
MYNVDPLLSFAQEKQEAGLAIVRPIGRKSIRKLSMFECESSSTIPRHPPAAPQYAYPNYNGVNEPTIYEDPYALAGMGLNFFFKPIPIAHHSARQDPTLSNTSCRQVCDNVVRIEDMSDSLPRRNRIGSVPRRSARRRCAGAAADGDALRPAHWWSVYQEIDVVRVRTHLHYSTMSSGCPARLLPQQLRGESLQRICVSSRWFGECEPHLFRKPRS